MSWGEGNYVETRFVKGMNTSVEPHTLDRDTGELPDIVNMLVRTEGLRTRKGWDLVDDVSLSGEFSPLPTNAPSAVFIYDTAPVKDKEDDRTTEDNDDDGTPGILPILDAGGNGSGGGSGRAVPKRKPEDVPSVSDSWALAGSGAIMPYVPYSLTLTYSGGREYPVADCFLVSKIPDGQAGFNYSRTAKNPWNYSVTLYSLSRDITGIKFKAGQYGHGAGEATVDYELYSFIPDVPGTMYIDTWHDFTISVKKGNETIGAYKGAGAGLTWKWVLVVNGEERECDWDSDAGAWSNGVYSSRVRIKTSVEGATAIRLKTFFLGEEKHDDAVLGADAVTVAVPSMLHVYGAASNVYIAITGGAIPPGARAVITAKVAGNIVNVNDYLEMSDGTAIDFTEGWSDGEWLGSVRAKTSAAACSLVLEARYNEVSGAGTIEVADEIVGALTCAGTAYAGVEFTSEVAVSGGMDVAVPRFPFASVSIAATAEQGAETTFGNEWQDISNWSDGVCSFTAVVSSPDTVVFTLGYSGEVLDTAEIEIESLSVEVTVEAPSALHVYGDGAQLKIAISTHEGTAQVVGKVGGTTVSLGDYLENDDGSPIDFSNGWESGQWTGVVRAKSSAFAANLEIVATYEGETGSDSIDIVTGIVGNIEMPARGYANVQLRGTLSIMGDRGLDIPRFDETLVVVTGTPEGSATVSLGGEWGIVSNWNNGRCDFTALVSASDTVKFEYYDGINLLDECEIDIFPAETFVFVDAPGTLHRYGSGKALRIEMVVDGLPPTEGIVPSVSGTVGGESCALTDYLEMADGTAIDFTEGWVAGVWEHDVRAKSSAENVVLLIIASSGSMSDSRAVVIEDDLQGRVDFSTGRVAPNEPFDLDLHVVSRTGEVLPRLPSGGGVTITHGTEDGTVATMLVNGQAPVFVFANGICHLTGCTVDTECVYVVTMTFGDGVETGDSISVSDAAVNVQALVEAINERRIVKNYPPLDVTADYTLSQLKAYGEDAINGFCCGELNAETGLRETYEPSGTLPDLPVQGGEQAWIESAYGTICSAVERKTTSLSYQSKDYYNPISGHYASTHKSDGVWNPSLAETKRKSEDIARELYQNRGRQQGAAYNAYVDKDWTCTVQGVNYRKYYVQCERLAVRVTVGGTVLPFSRTARFVAHDITGDISASDWKYNNFGDDVPPYHKYGYVLGGIKAQAGEAFGYTKYTGKSEEFVMASRWGYDRNVLDVVYLPEGFDCSITSCYVKFGFKHR